MTDIRTILAERGSTHGDYCEHANITQTLKRDMAAQPGWYRLHPHERETLDMIANKVGRILAGNPHFHDHWLDIAGYATLSADRNRPANNDHEDDGA